ncbi:MAG: signal recognition particle-docking protein FtsY [Betaproteobacteria bacterium]|nr:signal recognition particle-docking protein FtsY [Betaproteobacteria bacterium]
MLGLLKKSNPGAAPESPALKQSFLARLKEGLRNTRSQLTDLFTGRKLEESFFEDLESALIAADTGMEATAYLLSQLRGRAKKERVETAEQLRQLLRDILCELLSQLEGPDPLETTGKLPQPFVIMLAGVNGAGKTTSIGKLAKLFQQQGRSVLLAAGDTFRAAAREQLAAWGEKNGVAVISQSGGDPAAVIFDSVHAARARNIDVLLADTAGRLPTQRHLMDEVRKIKRVIGKADASAPHEVWLVLDANTGQIALNQVRAFDEALGLTGLILTKLDGTAKGGVVAGIAYARRQLPASSRPLAIRYLGVGEGLDDLRPFSASDFVAALLD